MTSLCLAIVVATGADGVPEEVVDEARALVQRVLEHGDAKVTVRLFLRREGMEAVVREVEPRAPADFAAYYHRATKTIYAYLAPRPDPPRFSGLLRGALVHEAHHARAHIAGEEESNTCRAEGEADRDTVEFLRGIDGTWELMLESRVRRALDRDLLGDDLWLVPPRYLPPAERASWYANAYRSARGGADPELPWVLWDGSAEPFDGGYRLVSQPGRAALLVREAQGSLDVRVKRTKGQVEILFGFRSEGEYAKVAFPPEGGVRAMWRTGGHWTRDPLHPAPRLAAGSRIVFRDGAISVDGRPVLYVQAPEGKVGVGVLDGLAEFRPSS